MTPQTLTVDDLQFELRWSHRRKTMEITVDREGKLVISAPEGTDTELMEKFVREKKFWLYTKIAEKGALRKPVVAKEFVTGEGFPYLGRSYRLLLVDEQEKPLKLDAGRFMLLRSEVDRGRSHFIDWYTAHARLWLRRKVCWWTPRMGIEPKGIEVRDLGFRWGSCGKKGILNFHWASILLPASIVEYVVVHELVHLVEPNHTPEFWLALERAMPDYEQRKNWLAENGAKTVGV